jgi:1-acyl-sn-glycerol-3-phosphate acyltransferase
MFYIKFLLVVVWFAICSTIALIVGILRWRNPSGGYVFTWLFTKPASKIIGFKVVVKNFERLDATQPCIYVCNHQSNLDMVTQAHCYRPKTICIGKKELLWIPFFGALFYVTGNILLDRKNHERAVEGMNSARDLINKKKLSVYVFPEGTRNKNPAKLLPFKKGAFYLAIAAQVPILPVVSSPIKPLVDSEKRKITPGIVTIEVLEPISTMGLTEDDVDSLIEMTHSRMQNTFDRLSLAQ